MARDLDEAYGGSYGAELHNPDFVRLAEAYGAVGLRAEELGQVGSLLRRALELERPVVLEVPVPPMPRPVFMNAKKPHPRYA